MALSEEELHKKMREGFSDDYFDEFGTLICYQPYPGSETICPACKLPCNKHTGHKQCRETYRRSNGPQDSLHQ